MSKKKQVLMRNDRDRVYNGIRPFQIISVNEDQVSWYRAVGFNVFMNTAEKKSDDQDLEARKEFLRENDSFHHAMKAETIIAKSDELGYWQDESVKDDESDALDDLESLDNLAWDLESDEESEGENDEEDDK